MINAFCKRPHAEVAETLKAGKVITGYYASPDADCGLVDCTTFQFVQLSVGSSA